MIVNSKTLARLKQRSQEMNPERWSSTKNNAPSVTTTYYTIKKTTTNTPTAGSTNILKNSLASNKGTVDYTNPYMLKNIDERPYSNEYKDKLKRQNVKIITNELKTAYKSSSAAQELTNSIIKNNIDSDTVIQANEVYKKKELTDKNEQINEFVNLLNANKQFKLDTYSDKLPYTKNVSFNVNTITSENEDEITSIINKRPDSIQEIFLKDGNDFIGDNDMGNIKEIGRNRLNGLGTKDGMVLYDTVTGKLYRYDIPDTPEKTKIANDLETCMSAIQSATNVEKESYKTMDITLQVYEDKLNKLYQTVADGKATSRTYQDIETYANFYKKQIEAIQELHSTSADTVKTFQEQYDRIDEQRKALGMSDVIPNSAWQKKMQEQLDSLKEAKDAYEKQSAYTADLSSDTQVNSPIDWLFKSYQNHKTVKNETDMKKRGELYKEAEKEDVDNFKELFGYLYGSAAGFFKDVVKVVGTENKSDVKFQRYGGRVIPRNTETSKAAKEASQELTIDTSKFVNNMLTSITETFDALMVLTKPSVVSYNTFNDEAALKRMGTKEYRDEAYAEAVQKYYSQINSGERVSVDFTRNADIENIARQLFSKRLRQEATAVYGKTLHMDYLDMYDPDSSGWQKFQNHLSSFVLEVVTDPMTYIDLAAKPIQAAGKEAARADVNKLYTEAIENLGGEISTDGSKEVIDNLTEQTLNHFYKHIKGNYFDAEAIDDITTEGFTKVIKEALRRDEENIGLKYLEPSAGMAYMQNRDKWLNNVLNESVPKLREATLNMPSYTALNSTRTAAEAIHGLDKAMFTVGTGGMFSVPKLATAIRTHLEDAYVPNSDQVMKDYNTLNKRLNGQLQLFTNDGKTISAVNLDNVATVIKAESKNLAEYTSVGNLNELQDDMLEAVIESKVKPELQAIKQELLNVIRTPQLNTDEAMANINAYIVKQTANSEYPCDTLNEYLELLDAQDVLRKYDKGKLVPYVTSIKDMNMLVNYKKGNDIVNGARLYLDNCNDISKKLYVPRNIGFQYSKKDKRTNANAIEVLKDYYAELLSTPYADTSTITLSDIDCKFSKTFDELDKAFIKSAENLVALPENELPVYSEVIQSIKEYRELYHTLLKSVQRSINQTGLNQDSYVRMWNLHTNKANELLEKLAELSEMSDTPAKKDVVKMCKKLTGRIEAFKHLNKNYKTMLSLYGEDANVTGKDIFRKSMDTVRTNIEYAENVLYMIPDLATDVRFGVDVRTIKSMIAEIQEHVNDINELTSLECLYSMKTPETHARYVANNLLLLNKSLTELDLEVQIAKEALHPVYTELSNAIHAGLKASYDNCLLKNKVDIQLTGSTIAQNVADSINKELPDGATKLTAQDVLNKGIVFSGAKTVNDPAVATKIQKRVYEITVGGIAVAVRVMNKPELYQGLDYVMTADSVLNNLFYYMERNIKGSYAPVDDFKNKAYALNTSVHFINDLAGLDFDKDLQLALIDVMSDKAVEQLNKIARNANIRVNDNILTASNKCKNKLIDNVLMYETNSKDVRKNKHFYYNSKHMCSADPKVLVNNMQEVFADFKDRLPEEDEFGRPYINVFVAEASTGDSSDPFAFACALEGDKEVKAFRNKQAVVNLYNEDAFYLYGLSTEEAMTIIESIDYNNSTFEYAKRIRAEMYRYKREAANNNATLRFISWNGSAMGTGSTSRVSNYFRLHNMHINNMNTIDLADILREDAGIKTFTVEQENQIANLFREALMTSSDYRSVYSDMFINFRNIMHDSSIAPNNILGNHISELRKTFDVAYVQEAVDELYTLYNCFEDVRKELGTVFADTDAFISESAVAEALNKDPSLYNYNMQEIVKAAGADKASYFALKRMINTDLFKELYGTDYLGLLPTQQDGIEISKNYAKEVHSYTLTIDNIRKNITNPKALTYYTADDLKLMANMCLDEYYDLAMKNGLDEVYFINSAYVRCATAVTAYSKDKFILYAVCHDLMGVLNEMYGISYNTYTPYKNVTLEKLTFANPEMEELYASMWVRHNDLIRKHKGISEYKIGEMDDKVYVTQQHQFENLFLLVEPVCAGDVVVFNTTRYADSNLYSNNVVYNADTDECTRTTLALKDEQLLSTMHKDWETLNAYLVYTDALTESRGIITTNAWIEDVNYRNILHKGTDMLKKINYVPKLLKIDVASEFRFDTFPVYPNITLERIYEAEAENMKHSAIAKAVRDISYLHKVSSAYTIMMLPQDVLEQFIARNAFNCIVINTNATIFKEKDMMFAYKNLLQTVEKSDKLSIIKDGDKAFIGVDISNKTSKEMDELLNNSEDTKYDFKEAYVKASLKYSERVSGIRSSIGLEKKACKLLYGYYSDYIKTVTPLLPETYCISNFTVYTQSSLEMFMNAIPEQFRLNANALNYKGYMDATFNCNVIGDFADENEFNMYPTTNIFNAIMNGLKVGAKGTEMVKNKLNVFNCKELTLAYIVKSTFGASSFKTMTPNYVKYVNSIIVNRGKCVAKVSTDSKGFYKVSKVRIDTVKSFYKALESDAIVIDCDVYSELLAYSQSKRTATIFREGSNGTKKLMFAKQKYDSNIRNARMIGWLFTNLSTSIHNMTDTTMKAVLEEGYKFLPYISRAYEENKEFSEVMEKIIVEFKTINEDTTVRYFEAHPELKDIKERFLYWLSFSDSKMVGLTESIVGKAFDNNAITIRARLPEELHISDETINVFLNEYQTISNKNAYTTKDNAYQIIEQLTNVAIDKYNCTDKQAEALANAYFAYTPAKNNAMSKIESVPVLGQYVQLMAQAFELPETICRYGMSIYEHEVEGKSLAQSLVAERKTLFDYSTKPDAMRMIEYLFPFSTFKLYNTVYWLDYATGLPYVMRLTNDFIESNKDSFFFDKDDIAVMAYNRTIIDKIQSGELDSYEDMDSKDIQFLEYLKNTLLPDDYQGMPFLYSSQNGYLNIGNNFLLKSGWSYFDALDIVSQFASAIPQMLSGEIPDLIKDNVYEPFVSLPTFLKSMWDNRNSGSDQWLRDYIDDNYYEAIDIVPFVGALINQVLTSIKNGKLAIADIKALGFTNVLQEDLYYDLETTILATLSTVLPGLIGRQKGDTSYILRPIGYDWYNQTDEYKSTHRFVLGVSALPGFVKKDVTTYVDYLGRYMKLGYSRDEALKILETLYGTDTQFKYSSDIFDETLEALVAKGYDINEALVLLQNEDLWYQEDATRVAKDKLSEDQSAFYSIYNSLPEYIRYTDGQYQKLKAYYLAKGYTYNEALQMMKTSGGYINEEGNFVTLDAEHQATMVNNLNDSYYEFMQELPTWIRYEDGAASRTISYLRNTYGYDLDTARQVMVNDHYYVASNGRVYRLTEEQITQKTNQDQAQFYVYYNTLPTYIKYEKGAYGRTLSYLLSNGATEETAKKMIQNGAYVTYAGNIIDCSKLTRTRSYNRKYASVCYNHNYSYTKRPKMKRYYYTKGNIDYSKRSQYAAQAATNAYDYKTGSKINTKRPYNSYYRTTMRRKQTYNPSDWRNLMHNLTIDIYKENYDSNGVSRMVTAKNLKGYTNRSTFKVFRQRIDWSYEQQRRRLY